MLLGLTGGIASGKNFVADLFHKKGCYVLDADFVSREVMKPGGIAYENVVNYFGNNILSDNLEIDRSKLRKIVIEHLCEKKALESIVHPAIHDYTVRWYKNIKSKDSKAIAVYHATLIIEAGLTDKFDGIILIYTSREAQLERLSKRSYPPFDDALKLLESQLPYEEKLKYANYIINNNDSKEYTELDVERVFNLIKTFQYTNNINRRKDH